MTAAGLFERDKWVTPEGAVWAQLLYDAGVSAPTKTAAMCAHCDLVCSGIVRKSKESNLSARQRDVNFSYSSLRIRVENFIGIVKHRYKSLGKVLPLDDLGMMDDIVYAAFMLHNFGHPVIF